ncbi:DUF2254 domain-containing protein [Rufibacter quisquiliarum]|uniref:Putative membrane protein n=1 Tax=Rufibacter quisquiliarum TaxID=1549639 RepID=A0A839GIB0_9BACT|nr:DUF2254 domain-containing protein [Rufibacter quisquiliarum]MBA9075355.1 putative membrane protein [Rufibacter quisquiliarum]
MNRLYKRFYQVFLSVSSSIALWPTVIAALFLLLGFFTFYFERTPAGIYLEKQLGFINSEPENARLILNTVVSGIISLLVFSFSMVMIVLGQATSHLSPRVIPGLISQKTNQMVLGIYVGTILYTLILILSFKPGEENTSVPVLGVLLTVLFGITCVSLFVYFIHTISRAIKPDTILTRIYKASQAALRKEVQGTSENQALRSAMNTEKWFELPSKEGGYLRQIEIENLNRIAKREDLMIEIPVSIGKFIVPGLPFLRLNKDIRENESLHDAIQDCFIFSLEEVLVFSFETGLRQISEVAVKALSPGINDPGTALSAIDFLTLLFLQRMEAIAPNCLLDEHQQVRIIKHPTPLQDLLYRFLTPIRTYGKADVMVMRKLLLCLNHLLYADLQNQAHTIVLSEQIKVIRDDADQSLQNPKDRDQIDLVLQDLNQHFHTSADKITLLSGTPAHA